MKDLANATAGARAGGGEVATRERAALLDVNDVATMLRCSPRTIYRLSDSRLMPPPVRLLSLVRWRKSEIEAWIADGCPRCGKGGQR